MSDDRFTTPVKYPGYLEPGLHEVRISDAQEGEWDSGEQYVRFTFHNVDGDRCYHSIVLRDSTFKILLSLGKVCGLSEKEIERKEFAYFVGSKIRILVGKNEKRYPKVIRWYKEAPRNPGIRRYSEFLAGKQ